MCVKRSVAKTAAASVEATTRAEQDRLRASERSKSACAADAASATRADDDADRARAAPPGRRPRAAAATRSAGRPRRGSAPSPTMPTSACELRVVELDPARAVRAEQHPDRRGRPRAPASPCAQRRARRRCSPPGCRPTSRSRRGLRPRVYLGRWESRRAAWNTSEMATRPRTRKIGRLSEIAAGRGPARLRLLLRAAQAHRHRCRGRARVEPSAEPLPARSVDAHLREMLDELGPTFVKFGQLLSTRPDVVPPDIVAELRRPAGRRHAVPVRDRCATSSRGARA